MTKEDLKKYDHIIVAFSGGKDSAACLLHTIEALDGDTSKLEIWHHDVDGQSGEFMDWAVTTDYCRQIADAFDIPFYMSWKQGGFKREMLRDNALTAPTAFETPEGEVKQAGGVKGKKNTRLMFPQVSANLQTRWCSAYLKIDVCNIAITNQDRFNGKRTLVITGERAEESANRAKYKAFEPHKADSRDGRKGRHVDAWRPVHSWAEQQVWDIIRRWGLNPHPAYKLGWGRVSCAACIFGSRDQWATLHRVNPDQVNRIAHYERMFGKTINRTKSIPELVTEGHVYQAATPELAAQATSERYTEPVFTDNWELPAGAFGESCGPV